MLYNCGNEHPCSYLIAVGGTYEPLKSVSRHTRTTILQFNRCSRSTAKVFQSLHGAYVQHCLDRIRFLRGWIWRLADCSALYSETTRALHGMCSRSQCRMELASGLPRISRQQHSAGILQWAQTRTSGVFEGIGQAGQQAVDQEWQTSMSPVEISCSQFMGLDESITRRILTAFRNRLVWRMYVHICVCNLQRVIDIDMAGPWVAYNVCRTRHAKKLKNVHHQKLVQKGVSSV